ncbi:MAG: nuclear transport factor 2 family protein [Chloroflexota bacterium]
MPPAVSPALALWCLFEAGAWDEARGLLHPDFVAHWPQSGERFRGPDNYLAVNREHPAPGWKLHVHRLVEGPGTAAVHVTLDHAEGVDHGACFYVVSRGRIREATELWAERSPAPAWRASWADPDAA